VSFSLREIFLRGGNRCLSYRRLGAPHRRYGRCEEKRNVSPPRIEPTFLGGQACSLSLYRLNYFGSLLAIYITLSLEMLTSELSEPSVKHSSCLLRRFCVDLDTGKHAVVEY
jgi:hypothetical protein